MRSARALVLFLVLAAAALLAYEFVRNRSGGIGSSIPVYYTELDGQTMGSYTVTLGPARDLQSVAFYAATQAVAGPPQDVEAIRFPPGTFVHSVAVAAPLVTVDLSGDVKNGAGGSFGESGEFKGLVWTMTALPQIQAVRVTVDGAPLATLPGGHLELDEPLDRSSW
ncbi:MAG TPA: GerMN domain-containing protein [Candidatus Acidoferrales bacterium]|nr:GerMN domain-containing protein [Candidatus Acidoferrales bacterium]